jgi:hypothetical protein
VRDKVAGPVRDTFDNLSTGGPVTDWNIYSPKWAPVRVVEFPDAKNKSLQLQDQDPYDYARAVRVFPESTAARVRLKVHAGQNNTGRLEVELLDRFGNRPVRLAFRPDGSLAAMNGGKEQRLAAYEAGKWYDIEIQADVKKGVFGVAIDNKPLLTDAAFAEYVKSIERISLRTGTCRNTPNRRTKTDPQPDLTNPNPDAPEPLAVYHVDDVAVSPLGGASER